MNVYSTHFSAVCPVNGADIHYHLTIMSNATVPAEDVLSATSSATGLHEEIADELAKLGGRQIMHASHHGVEITSYRGHL